MNPEGNLEGQPYDIVENYRATTRPWYRAAKAANKPTWSKIYQSAQNDANSLETRLEISAAQPYQDPVGSTGVFLTALDLSDISRFLSQIKVSSLGRIFIIERDGLLVASSSPAPIFIDNNGKAERLATTASTDPFIEDLADTLVEMGMTENLEKFLPLLSGEHRVRVLEIAKQLSGQFRNSENINIAVSRAAKIIYALKSYSNPN